MKWLLPFIIALFGAASGYAQDIESVVKSPWFKPSGSIILQASYYNTDHPNPQQDQLFWSLNGNFSTTVKTITIPFSISINKRQSSYTLPFNQLRSFNQFGMSPNYKNLTLHAGNRSLSFSPYTLSGQTFLGGGFEWRNAKNTLQVKTLGGQFARADLSGQAFALPFNRYGYGAYIASEGNTSIAGTYLHFWDEAGSSLDSVNTPMTNQVVGIKASHEFNEKVTLSGDVNISGYMESLAANERAANPLTQERSPQKSTFSAMEFQLERNGSGIQIGLTYRRIEPGYQTMGAPYVNSDMEDLTGQFSTQVFKNKVSIGTSVGAQRNNLNAHLPGTQLRTVGSIQLNWQVNNNLNYSVNAANFTVNPTRVLLYQIDSMQLYQINSNVNQTTTYALRKTEALHSFVLNHNYQTASTAADNTVFHSVMLAYTGTLQASKWHWTLSTSYFEGSLSETKTHGYSPTIAIGKKLLKSKVSIRGTYGYQVRNTLFVEQTQIATATIGYQYKKQSIGISGSWMDRASPQTAREELRINLNYGIRL